MSLKDHFVSIHTQVSTAGWALSLNVLHTFLTCAYWRIFLIFIRITLNSPGIEDFSYVFELSVVCLAVGVNVLIHVVMQVVHGVVVGHLGVYGNGGVSNVAPTLPD
jgi:uncharacterized membrane protein YhdT